MKPIPEYEMRSLMERRRARDLRDVGVIALGAAIIAMSDHGLPAWGAIMLLAPISALLEFGRVMVVFAGFALAQFVPAGQPWMAAAWVGRELPLVGTSIWAASALLHRGLWWYAHRWWHLGLDDNRMWCLLGRDVVIALGLFTIANHLLPKCFVLPSHIASTTGIGWQIAAIVIFSVMTARAELDRAYTAEIRPPLLEHAGLPVTARTDEVLSRAMAMISQDAIVWLTTDSDRRRPESASDQSREEREDPPRGPIERFKRWLFAEDL